MQVDNTNYDNALPLMLEAVGEADFIAIDTELAGLAPEAGLMASMGDTLASRLCKALEAARKHVVLQFGICAVRWDESSGAFLAKPFSVSLWPPSGRRFVVEAGSFGFLRRQGFNFDRWVHGVPFLSREARDRGLMERTRAVEAQVLRPKDPPRLRRTDSRAWDFLTRLCGSIASWVGGDELIGAVREGVREAAEQDGEGGKGGAAGGSDGGAGSSGEPGGEADVESAAAEPVLLTLDAEPGQESLLLPPVNGFHRYIVRFVCDVALPGAIVEQRAEDQEADAPHWARRVRLRRVVPVGREVASAPALRTLCARSLDSVPRAPASSEALAARRAEAEEEVAALARTMAERAGFLEVMEAIRARQCPVVVHNGLLDLAHTVTSFVAPAPPMSPLEWSQGLLRPLFPLVFDTKAMAEGEPALFRFMRNSSLQAVFNAAFASPPPGSPCEGGPAVLVDARLAARMAGSGGGEADGSSEGNAATDTAADAASAAAGGGAGGEGGVGGHDNDDDDDDDDESSLEDGEVEDPTGGAAAGAAEAADPTATTADSAGGVPGVEVFGADGAAHDSGYDAWITACAFARLAVAMGVAPSELRGLQRSSGEPSKIPLIQAPQRDGDKAGTDGEEGASEEGAGATPAAPAAPAREMLVRTHGNRVNLLRAGERRCPMVWSLDYPLDHPQNAPSGADAPATKAGMVWLSGINRSITVSDVQGMMRVALRESGAADAADTGTAPFPRDAIAWIDPESCFLDFRDPAVAQAVIRWTQTDEAVSLRASPGVEEARWRTEELPDLRLFTVRPYREYLRARSDVFGRVCDWECEGDGFEDEDAAAGAQKKRSRADE